tara:strand:+ start:669 stop:821 length:153 start_codon:yes stop_codon:yes gene_type:complete
MTKYKFILTETYRCEVDIPRGMSVEEYIHQEELPYDWSMPDNANEYWEKV